MPLRLRMGPRRGLAAPVLCARARALPPSSIILGGPGPRGGKPHCVILVPTPVQNMTRKKGFSMLKLQHAVPTLGPHPYRGGPPGGCPEVPSARLVACAGATQTSRSGCTESFYTPLGPLRGPFRAPLGAYPGLPKPPRAAKWPETLLGAPFPSHPRLPRSPWDSPAAPTCPHLPPTVPMGPGYGAQGGPRLAYGAHGTRLRCPRGLPYVPTGAILVRKPWGAPFRCPGGPYWYGSPLAERAVRRAEASAPLPSALSRALGLARHGREPKTRLLCACWLCCSAVRAGNDSVR